MAPSPLRSRRLHRLPVARVADHDVAEPALEVLQVHGEAEDGHHLGRHRDVEAVLAREAVGSAAERIDDRAQRAIVHVHHAAPGYAPRVEPEGVAPVDVIVDQRREQVVGGRDGVEVAGEVEVDVLHRHDLRVAAAGRAALDAEAGPERRLAQAAHGLLADAVEAVAEADRGRGLALAGRRRADGRDEDELAVLVLLRGADEIGGDLGLVGPVVQQRAVGDADLLSDLHDRLHLRFARNLDVGLHGHVCVLPSTSSRASSPRRRGPTPLSLRIRELELAQDCLVMHFRFLRGYPPARA